MTIKISIKINRMVHNIFEKNHFKSVSKSTRGLEWLRMILTRSIYNDPLLTELKSTIHHTTIVYLIMINYLIFIFKR